MCSEQQAQHEQAPMAQQPQAPAFFLSPEQGNNMLNFSQAHNVKTYYTTIALLPTEDCFDGTTHKVVVFLATVEDSIVSKTWSIKGLPLIKRQETFGLVSKKSVCCLLK